ncbi:MAG: hypothetical protein ACOYIP_02940 [Coriobacteriales bacterium]|jgi:hypothetical protein
MRKLLIIGLAAAFAMALVGCSSQEQPAQEEQQAGMANPWTEASSAAEAATNAGIGTFEVADNAGLGPEFPLGEPYYQSMSGIAETQYNPEGCKVVVRKGTVTGQSLSGDYAEYPETWTQDVDGTTVTCMGYETDCASNISWGTDTGYFSVVFISDGGENYGLTSEEIPALVANVK